MLEVGQVVTVKKNNGNRDLDKKIEKYGDVATIYQIGNIPYQKDGNSVWVNFPAYYAGDKAAGIIIDIKDIQR